MTIRNMLVLDGKVFLAPRPNTLLVSCLRLRIQYTCIGTAYLEAVSSTRNPRTLCAMVTGTHITWGGWGLCL